MTTSPQIKSSSILLVEGKDECNFFNKLLESLKIPHVQCIDVGGVDQFKNKFEPLSKTLGFENVNKIAFVRDADVKGAQSALDSLKSDVQNANARSHNANVRFDIKDISLAANVKDINGVRCGVYIMPDNQSSGMLEDLCIKYMKTDPICHCVEGYISCVQKNGVKFKNKSKSTIFSYLSAKLADAPTIGIAAQKNVFDFNNECFGDIKNFLLKMFL